MFLEERLEGYSEYVRTDGGRCGYEVSGLMSTIAHTLSMSAYCILGNSENPRDYVTKQMI